MLRQESSAAAQWSAECVVGGEFADIVAGYAPDLRMGLDERKAQDLGVIMRALIGVGTPRGLQGRFAAVVSVMLALRTGMPDGA